MEWHEIIAWIIIAVAFIVATAWCIRRILCPKSKCAGCDKDCRYRRKTNEQRD
ncbi:MAG: hypothetical protein IKA04_10940 [Alistipes sp.]|nr:hypothetical protein [Alistipes sp.]